MRNVSPADERQPQGLRAHIHTFTMRAFSDSSAKRFAHCGPSRSSSAKNSPSTPPPPPHPIQNFPSTPPSAASPVQNSPNSPFPTACAGQNSPCTPPLTACAVQNSPSTPPPTPHPVENSPSTPPSAASPVQNSPGTRKDTRFGRFSVCRAILFTVADQTGRAGEFLLRAQPPLRLGILPLTSRPPSWRRPSSEGKINKQPPHSASTIRQ